MDKETVEEDVINIDVLDTIGDNDVIVIPEGIARDDPGYAGKPVSVSGTDTLGTGNILKQVFNLIAQIRSKEYWKLNETEIKSLNKICPKVLPQTVVKHSGLIGCILSLLGIIVKRLKMEHQDAPIKQEPELDNTIDSSEEIQKKPLTGGRND